MDTGDAILVETWFFAVLADTVALIPWNLAVGGGVSGIRASQSQNQRNELILAK